MKLVFKNFITMFGLFILNILLLKSQGYLNKSILLITSFFWLVSFLINYRRLVKPISKLHTALKTVNFNFDIIDCANLDTLEVNNSYKEITFIIDKFKYLLDIISERINKVNSEVYKSEHDALTKCYNRVYLQKMKGIYETSTCYTVCFIDVNNLKRMNDEFGHKAGDILLKTAADKLVSWSNIADVYRLGGDEFMLVIRNMNFKQVDKMIRDWYPTVGLLNRTSDGFKCVLSYGLAQGYRGSNFDLVMKEADEKMYDMKVALKRKFGEPMR